MFNSDDLIVKAYWLLRKLTCYSLLAENAILLKDTTSLYLNLIMFYYQVANKTVYTKTDRLLFYEKNIKRYEYVFIVFDKVKPFLKRKTFTEFLNFYGKVKPQQKLKTNKLSVIWETLDTPIDKLTTDQMVIINERNKEGGII